MYKKNQKKKKKERKTNKYITIEIRRKKEMMNKSKILVMLSRERDCLAKRCIVQCKRSDEWPPLRRLPYCWVPPYWEQAVSTVLGERRDRIEKDKTCARGREQRQGEEEKKNGGEHTCILEKS